MADDKQDTGAAIAYEAAAGQIADDAQSNPKAASADKSAAKKAVSEPAIATKAKNVEAASAPAPAIADKVEAKPEPVKSAAGNAPAKKISVNKAPARKHAGNAVANRAPARTVAPGKVKKPVAKPAAKKTAAVRAAAKAKAISRPEEKAPLVAQSPATPAAKAQVKTIPFPPARIVNITQEFVKMTDAEMMTKSFQGAVAEMTAKSQDAYKKGTEMFKEAGEFTKGNIEAFVESGKIFATGMQEMGKAAFADSKAEFEALTAEVKEMASVKSPTDFFQLQSTLLRKNFDKAVAMSSKNTEAMLKLANDATQPLSTRMSLAMEKIKAA